MSIRLEARVARARTLTIGGERVDVLVVESTRRVTGENFRARTEATTSFSPAHSLIVADDQRTTGSTNGSDFEMTLDVELVSLRPE